MDFYVNDFEIKFVEELVRFQKHASGERSFSVLKKTKNYLLSSLENEKTSALSILCIENKIVKNINRTSLVTKLSKLKARKKHLDKVINHYYY